MKRIIRLTESDLTRIVRRVIKESEAGAATVGPASYADYIVGETDNRNVWGSKGSTVDPYTHSKWGAGVVGNKIVVNADRFSYDNGTYNKIGSETVTLYQKCGAQANLMTEYQLATSGDPVKYSKMGGPIQKKIEQSCRAQGFKGEILRGVDKRPA
jgi:hypothetical protein